MKKANAWGLYDMHGNVYEWCRDWYDAKLPGGTDPENLSQAADRVYRGGSWFGTSVSCRSAYRSRYLPTLRDLILGFRPARSQSNR